MAVEEISDRGHLIRVEREPVILLWKHDQICFDASPRQSADELFALRDGNEFVSCTMNKEKRWRGGADVSDGAGLRCESKLLLNRAAQEFFNVARLIRAFGLST